MAAHRACFSIRGEDPQDFYNLLAESFETHKPSTIEHSALVTDSVLAHWFLWRRQRAHAKRESALFDGELNDNSLDPAGLKELELFDRYKTQAERAVGRALARPSNQIVQHIIDDNWRFCLDVEHVPRFTNSASGPTGVTLTFDEWEDLVAEEKAA